MSSVLISYAPPDGEFAQQLHRELRAAEVQVIADSDEFALEDIVTTISAVIIVVSAAVHGAERVQQITDFARDHELRMLVVIREFTPLVPPLDDLPRIDMSTTARFRRFMPGLVDILTTDSSVRTVAIPSLLRINDPRNLCLVDHERFLGVLAVVAAPYADSSGNQPPHEQRDGELIWHQFASSIAALDADGVTNVLLSRLMPPTAEQLSIALQVPYEVVIICAASADYAILLEDEWGREASLYPQYVLTMFQDSLAKLLILHGDMPSTDAEILIEESNLEALVQVSSAVASDSLTRFCEVLLAEISREETVASALHTASTTVGIAPAQLTLVVEDEGADVRIPLPPRSRAAGVSLIDDGMPLRHNVPIHSGFVGRRESLFELTTEIASSAFRQIAIYGEQEAGKSWLAARYVAHQAWRYPDGVLWMHIAAQSKSEDTVGQLLALLELPPDTNWNTLREILRGKRVLIVLDQLDEWDDPLEIGELADFIARLETLSGTRVLLTAWGPIQPITFTSGTEENSVHPLAVDEARQLVARYVAHYQLDEIFAEPGAIEAFTTVTQYEPWLIREAIQLVGRLGFAGGLEAMKEITQDVADPFESHMRNQIEAISPQDMNILRRLQALRDGFTIDLIYEIAPETDAATLRSLLKMDMLRREGKLYRVPLIVQYYLRQYLPLADEERDTIDAAVIQFMLRGQE